MSKSEIEEKIIQLEEFALETIGRIPQNEQETYILTFGFLTGVCNACYYTLGIDPNDAENHPVYHLMPTLEKNVLNAKAEISIERGLL